MTRFIKASLLFIPLLMAPLACEKSYTLAPLSANAPTNTPTFTSTSTATRTPCGYPGNTCTFTYTYTYTYTFTSTATPTPTNTPTNTGTFTYTGTPTYTYTITNTPTITPTSSVLLPPDGFLGKPQIGTNKLLLSWIMDSDPRVTYYVVYLSPTGLPGSYSASITYTKPAYAPPVELWVTSTSTTFNAYCYVVSGGSLPDSAPSRIVHAVSGTTATNSYTVTTAPSLSPTFNITSGSVAGAVKHVWLVPSSGINFYWMWGDEGAPLMSSVPFGYFATGNTYITPSMLPPGTAFSGILETYNSSNYCIDRTNFSFSTP